MQSSKKRKKNHPLVTRANRWVEDEKIAFMEGIIMWKKVPPPPPSPTNSEKNIVEEGY